MSNGDTGNEKQRQSDSPSWKRIAADFVKAYANSHGPQNKFASAENKAANWTAAATVLIAIFTAATIGVGIAQWSVLRNTLVEANRAWIGTVLANYEAPNKQGEPIKFVVYVSNSGREPALDVLTFSAIVPVVGTFINTDKFNAYVSARDICKGVHPIKNRGVIFHSDSSGESFTAEVGPKNILTYRQITEGGWAVMLRECIAYNTFGHEHRTAFCYYYIPGKTDPKRLLKCTFGQFAD
ncbi:MAG TPA: hypothetical protein VNX86_01010 [Rhizomicrobium sp.]|jgi:hypothetical protein|nr:hypothetical protein [Rhizomicrobium sp.]